MEQLNELVVEGNKKETVEWLVKVLWRVQVSLLSLQEGLSALSFFDRSCEELCEDEVVSLHRELSSDLSFFEWSCEWLCKDGDDGGSAVQG